MSDTTQKKAVEKFTCPYDSTCVWPKCQNWNTSINYPCCGNEIARAKAAVLRRFTFEPRRKAKR